MWVWVNCGSWWWTGRPGVLRFMGSQRVGHDWATELNWNIHKAWRTSKDTGPKKQSGGRRPENKMKLGWLSRGQSQQVDMTHTIWKKEKKIYKCPGKECPHWHPGNKTRLGCQGWNTVGLQDESRLSQHLSPLSGLYCLFCTAWKHNFLMQTCQLRAKSTFVYSSSGSGHGHKNLENPNAVQVCSQCWSLL